MDRLGEGEKIHSFLYQFGWQVLLINSSGFIGKNQSQGFSDMQKGLRKVVCGLVAISQ